MMIIASNAAPHQSHCCWALGSSSFISPDRHALRRDRHPLIYVKHPRRERRSVLCVLFRKTGKAWQSVIVLRLVERLKGESRP